MDYKELSAQLKTIPSAKWEELYPDETYISVNPDAFRQACELVHKKTHAAVATFFARDKRGAGQGFGLYCAFMTTHQFKKWVIVCADIAPVDPRFDSLAKTIYSASLFEREIKEMFGIEPAGNPDLRGLRLHEESWPAGFYPLRKDFQPPDQEVKSEGEYRFTRGEGEGLFEVPVGPVHAGIIGPGHFRFSVAGEPIINLEIRLGFTHRGVEKIFEGKTADQAVAIAERVCGDTAFGHSLAFCRAVEKISGLVVPDRGRYIRAIFLEMERMYNHVSDIGGIALDVGFGAPANLAGMIKESLQQLNKKISSSRFLKGINACAGVAQNLDGEKTGVLRGELARISKDLDLLTKILFESVSFMDRVDGTGILRKDTALDLGISGLAARACGISLDLRKDFCGVYPGVKAKVSREYSGDVLSRLKLRIFEFRESLELIRGYLDNLPHGSVRNEQIRHKSGFGLGYAEAWRGPVIYWVCLDEQGRIERCKIADPSFKNWQGLAFGVLGDIIPDFPVCNKSFDLSYSGTDL